MIKNSSLFLVFFLSAYLCAQVNLPEDPEKIIAQVDSIKITAEEFYFGYEYGPAFIKREKESKKRYLNYMINEKLLALDGYARSIDTTEQAEGIINEFKADLASEELFKKDVLSKVNLTESEIDSAVNKKNIQVEIKWLFAESSEKMNRFLLKINEGVLFDSLFNMQINDTVFYNDRYLVIDRFKLEQQNYPLAVIIDSLRPGEISLPVHVDDGWYLFKLNDVQVNLISSEEEYQRLKQEAINALTKIKMDKISDVYVNSLMSMHNPVIKRNTFNLLRSYLGNMLLSKKQYGEWDLSEKLKNALENLNKNGGENLSEKVLIELNDGNFTLKDFLTWYRNRSLYVKLDNRDLQSFSSSLEGLVWRMARDRLLGQTAEQRGFDELPSVNKQLSWWKDKIISSIVKNEIAASIELNEDELDRKSGSEENSKEFSQEFSAKLFRKVTALRKEYDIKIDEKSLQKIDVSVEKDPRAIEFYTVKKGGLLPRTPYPTIDHDWVNWE